MEGGEGGREGGREVREGGREGGRKRGRGGEGGAGREGEGEIVGCERVCIFGLLEHVAHNTPTSNVLYVFVLVCV